MISTVIGGHMITKTGKGNCQILINFDVDPCGLNGNKLLKDLYDAFSKFDAASNIEFKLSEGEINPNNLLIRDIDNCINYCDSLRKGHDEDEQSKKMISIMTRLSKAVKADKFRRLNT